MRLLNESKKCTKRVSLTSRLFLKEFCRYNGNPVHETILADGKLGFFKHKIDHYSYRNYNHYIEKLNHYAALRAKQLHSQGKKVSLYHILIKPPVRFFVHYVVRLGFLDGFSGFLIAGDTVPVVTVSGVTGIAAFVASAFCSDVRSIIVVVDMSLTKGCPVLGSIPPTFSASGITDSPLGPAPPANLSAYFLGSLTLTGGFRTSSSGVGEDVLFAGGVLLLSLS